MVAGVGRRVNEARMWSVPEPATARSHGGLWSIAPQTWSHLEAMGLTFYYLHAIGLPWLWSCVGKTYSSSCVFLLYSHTTTPLTLLTPDVWVCFPTSRDSLWDTSWVSYNSIPFWQYLELAQIPRVKDSVPYGRAPISHPPHPHFRCHLQVLGCHLYFWSTSYKSGFPVWDR